MQLLPLEQREGSVTVPFLCPRGKNMATVVARFGAVHPGVGFKFLIEQFDGQRWCVLGGADISDVVANNQMTPEWRFYEQIVEDPKHQPTTRRYVFNGKTFKQFAICPQVRVSCESYWAHTGAPAPLEYSLDLVAEERALPVHFQPIFGSR